jgi:hypothetical protein
MIKSLTPLIFGFFLFSCKSQTEPKKTSEEPQKNLSKKVYTAKITQKEFFASYKGADFVEGDDIAHQLSNFVADTLGKHLKMEYKNGRFKKIDFDKTIIKTEKYHPDSVYYTIKMPFISVTACEAYTCIDHRGSWISLVRKTDSDLKDFVEKISIEPNHKEEIKLFKTDFGLYEYWVQYRHPVLQKDCK